MEVLFVICRRRYRGVI